MAHNLIKPTPYRPLPALLLTCLLVALALWPLLILCAALPPTDGFSLAEWRADRWWVRCRATSLPLGGNEGGLLQKPQEPGHFSRFFVPSWSETTHYLANVPNPISTAYNSYPETPYYSASMPHSVVILPPYCAIFPQCPISLFFPILGHLGHLRQWNIGSSHGRYIDTATAMGGWELGHLETLSSLCYNPTPIALGDQDDTAIFHPEPTRT